MMAFAGRKDAQCGIRAQDAGLCILIVDDDSDTAQGIAILLRIHGHDVKICPSGQPARDAAQAEEPDVILLHLSPLTAREQEMANELGGIKVSSTPLLIAVVGLGQAADKQLSAECGIDLHLVMPVDPARLVAALRDFQRLLYTQSLPGGERWQNRRTDGFGIDGPYQSLRFE
jgi:DNA-binding response OmpR family regulator